MITPRPGQRLVIRYADGGQSTDAIGTVTAVTDAAIELNTKQGRITVPTAAVELVHEIPPAPTSPGRLHRVVSAEDLRRIRAAVWLPEDAVWLNADNLRAEAADADAQVQSGWLLRAAHGVSRRANSALPLTDPGIDPEQALDVAIGWYTDRGLAPQVQIFSSALDSSSPANSPADHPAASPSLAAGCAPVAELFRAHGFRPSAPTLALTADAAAAAGQAEVPAGLQIVLSDDAHRPHFDAWQQPEDSPEHADFAQLIRSPERFTIVSAIATHPDGSRSLVGTVRLAIAMKWAVVSNLVVDPGLRRRGAGRALVQAALSLAARQGVRSALAEVEVGNTASLELFSGLGFSEHHRYWYAQRQAPSQG